MSSPEPSLDPNRTVAHDAPPQPETVNVSQEQATGATGPYVPAPPAEAPTIPGYRIEAEIAKGGMGRVYAGYDLTLDREVAIKTLLPGANAERFVTEAKITARLPHPGIPPVYALGTLEDGTPWLAMKLIRGRTLAELLKKRSSPSEELPRFIQIFEQIAQAVGFAHSRGIIHRDLKPLNVMVGEFGEVQVMDWGLAKELASRPRQLTGESEPDDWRRRLAADENVHHTAAGTIMGTPGYMAPEQARGEPVDARADVFALGSILAAILTGQPAFVGTTINETIAKAANADLTDVLARLEACGADAELLAIARRCLAALPQDRFADGREVASAVASYRATVEARLRQAETAAAEALVREAEQRKRRRLAIAAGGSIAVVLLVGLAVSLWQMQRAVRAEAIAVENERQALANAELAQSNEAKAVAERDAKDVALQAEQKALREKSAALAAEQKARAAERVALDRAKTALRSMTDEIVENQMARGTTLTEENKQFLRTILKQFEALAAVTGDDAESRGIRAEGLARVGLMRYRLGELKEAEAAWRDALALRKQLAADFPTRPEFRHNLAKSHNNLGVLLSNTGRLQEAEAVWRDALALQKQLAADFPTSPDYRQELACSYNNLGILLSATGRPKEAEAAFRDALAIQKQLATDFPTRPDFRQELATSHNNLGILLYQTGRPKEAEAAFRDTLAIRQQLATDFPTLPNFRQELAASHNNLGFLLYKTGRLKEAEAAYRDALALQKQLAADFLNQPDLRNDLAGTLVNLARLCNQQRDYAAAKGYLDEALPHRQAALKANPRHPTYRQFYRNHLWTLAQAQAGLLDRAAAVKTAEQIRDLGWDAAGNAYDAARALAMCIPIVAKHEMLDAEGRQAAVQFYGDEAMKLLRDAVAKGFKDAAQMKADRDLAPLRNRADFQKLLAELEARP